MDISMCKNETCTLKDTCLRYKGEASPIWQSYSDFKQDNKGNCDYYYHILPSTPLTEKEEWDLFSIEMEKVLVNATVNNITKQWRDEDE